jgi:hypothetical protein
VERSQYPTRLPDLSPLVSHWISSILCIQETHLRSFPSLTFRGFEIYRHDHIGGERANGGTAIFVRDCVYSVSVPLHTTLHAVAVRIYLDALSFTICKTCLPPALPVADADLVLLISQLPVPFVLLGDFNAKHIVWGSDINNDRGVFIHYLSSLLNLSLLNSGANTHFCLTSGTSSALDLTLCGPGLSTHLEWSVLCDLHDSDEFPVNVHIASSRVSESRHPNWILKKAYWMCFSQSIQLDNEQFPDVDSVVDHFANAVFQVAAMNIPRSPVRSRPLVDC